jgi:predicted transposase YdaD
MIHEDAVRIMLREKAERDRLWLRNLALAEGREEGRRLARGKGWAEGWDEGLRLGMELGRITACRELLGLPVLAQVEWQGKSLEELKKWADRLETEVARLFPRNSQLICRSQPPAKPY